MGQVLRNKSSQNFPTVRSELSDGPAYSKQQVSRLLLDGAPVLMSTTVATGVIAQAYQVQTGTINGFTTRFGSTFDEYRIVGANIKVSPVSPTTGVSKVWFDEKSNSAPTANEAQERTSTPLCNSNAQSKAQRVFTWRAKDLLDLQYTAIGTVVNPVTFKLYTDLATWGAPAAVTAVWIVESEFFMEFRGIKST